MTKIRKVLQHPYLMVLFRLIIGITFIYASYYKVLDPSEFAKSIYNYRMLPVFTVNIMAIIIPWVELICGVFLVLGILTRENALILTILLLVFSVAVGSVIIRGIDVECGCFKKASDSKTAKNATTSAKTNKIFTEKVGLSLLGRDLLMLVMALMVFFSRMSPFEFDYYLFTGRRLHTEVVEAP